MSEDIKIEEVTPSPKGRNDTARGLLIILLIGIALFAVLIWGKSGERQEVATSEPTVEKAEPQEAPKEEPAETVVEIILPRFDLVRVESDGSAVIAGSSEGSGTVILNANDEELARTDADEAGKFVFLANMPVSDAPIQLTLFDGNGNTTGEVVLVRPATAAEDPGKIIIVDEFGEVESANIPAEKPTEKPTAPNITPLTLDTINYTETGSVVLGGQLTDGQDLRVYIDNEPAKLAKAQDGQWSVELVDIDEGLYTLRVDALEADGSVAERVESPFKRVYPEVLGPDVTIQPGYTLWKLAEIKYGSGDRYIQIVNANRDIIKDPDLIYPGQLFDLPDAE